MLHLGHLALMSVGAKCPKSPEALLDVQCTGLYFAFSLGEFISYSLLIIPGNVEVLQLSKPFTWEQIESQPFSP